MKDMQFEYKEDDRTPMTKYMFYSLMIVIKVFLQLLKPS